MLEKSFASRETENSTVLEKENSEAMINGFLLSLPFSCGRYFVNFLRISALVKRHFIQYLNAILNIGYHSEEIRMKLKGADGGSHRNVGMNCKAL